jgi:hypothetical protein
MERIVARFAGPGRFIRRIGPLLLIEVLLPGGTLIALLLILCRSGRLSAGRRMAGMATLVPAHVRIVNACTHGTTLRASRFGAGSRSGRHFALTLLSMPTALSC